MNERREKLLRKLRGLGRVTIEVEAAEMGVSAMTIRRDLQALEDLGLAQRVHGGAVPRERMRAGFMMDVEASPEQKRIADAVLPLLADARIVMLSVGTTTLRIARRIAASDLSLTVVTNSLPIAATLFQTSVQVVLTGGSLRTQSIDLVGPIAEKNLSEFHIDVLVSGCDGAVADEGFFTTDVNLAAMERKSVEVSDQVIMATTSSKFGRRAFAKFADLQDVSTLVIDDRLAEPDRVAMAAADIRIVSV